MSGMSGIVVSSETTWDVSQRFNPPSNPTTVKNGTLCPILGGENNDMFGFHHLANESQLHFVHPPNFEEPHLHGFEISQDPRTF